MSDARNINRRVIVPVRQPPLAVLQPASVTRPTIVRPANLRPHSVVVPIKKGRLHLIIDIGRREKIWVVSGLTILILLNLVAAAGWSLGRRTSNAPSLPTAQERNAPGGRGYEICPPENPCRFDKIHSAHITGDSGAIKPE